MKKRYIELDVLRALSIIGVLLIHVSAQVILSKNGVTNGVMNDIALFINQISRFAVPVFLVLSGWGLTMSNSLKHGYLSFVRKQISKIIILYTVWSVIYYVATVHSFSISKFIKNFILGSTFYHLYFVPLIIVFYLIYPLILKIGKSNLGLIFMLVITIFSQEVAIITGIGLLNNIRNIFNWIFFFTLGSWLANDYDSKVEKLQKFRSLIIVLFITTLSAVFFESSFLIDKVGINVATTSTRPSIILLSVLFIAIFLGIKWENNYFIQPLIKLATFSYGVYLSHAFFLTLFNKVYVKLGFSMESILYMPVAFIVVLAVSIFVTIGINKIIAIISDEFKNHNTLMLSK